MVEVGDVLYALYGATSGEVAISKIRGAINQAILCIKSEQNHYFIYSYLFSKKENIIRTFLQGGQGNLSSDIVKKIRISMPSLIEQKKISSLLSLINERISLSMKIIRDMQLLKNTVSKKLF